MIVNFSHRTVRDLEFSAAWMNLNRTDTINRSVQFYRRAITASIWQMIGLLLRERVARLQFQRENRLRD